MADRSAGVIVAQAPEVSAGFHTLYHHVARRTDLSYAAKVAYSVLCSFYRLDRTYPGHAVMAYEIGVGTRGGNGRTTVSRIMRDLETAGLIAVRRRGQNLTNEYVLLPWADQGGCTKTVHPDAPKRCDRTYQKGAPLPSLKNRTKEGNTAKVRRSDVCEDPAVWRAEAARYGLRT